MSNRPQLQRLGQSLHQLETESIRRDPALADRLRTVQLGLLELRSRIGHGGLSSTGHGLVVQIWNKRYALPLSDIEQILPATEASRLAERVRVIDLRTRLGLPAEAPAGRSLLILQGARGPVGLLVDRLDRLVDLGQIETPPLKVLAPDQL